MADLHHLYTSASAVLRQRIMEQYERDPDYSQAAFKRDMRAADASNEEIALTIQIREERDVWKQAAKVRAAMNKGD